MKYTLFTAGMLLTGAAFCQQNTKAFSLDGTLKNIPGVTKIYLAYRSNGEQILDSAAVVNNKFLFKGVLAEPTQANMRVVKGGASGNPAPPSRKDIAAIFLMPAPMKVTAVDSFTNVNIQGSKANDDLAIVQAQIKPINDRDQALYQQYQALSKAKDAEGMKKIEAQSEALGAERNAVYTKFLQANPASPLAVNILSNMAGYDIDAAKIQPLFDKLPAATKQYPSAVDLQSRIEIARKTAIGQEAMDFTQNDTLGKPVSLKSLRGKVLLVDFWASWCGPCRRENPNVVKAFNSYKDKGFHILGVSLDQPGAQEKWIKAIHDDGLTWTHVSDLKYWNNDAAKEYGIRGIPFNLLLDKDGKIIGKNLRGEALEAKLAEVMPK